MEPMVQQHLMSLRKTLEEVVAPALGDNAFAAEQAGLIAASLALLAEVQPHEDDLLRQEYADLAAAQAAIALAAKRLVFISDVPGLLRNPDDAESVIPHLDIAEVDELKQAGVIAKGMIPKVDSAVAAINAGVDKVSFVDGRMNHSVLLEIFTDKGVGTEIVK